MLRRLVEAHYLSHRAHPQPTHVAWWLAELRSPVLLIETASSRAEAAWLVATVLRSPRVEATSIG